MTYWRGTNIPKSANNAFNWREGDSPIAKDLRRLSVYAESGMRGGQVSREIYRTPKDNTINAYSRAKPKE